MLELTHSLLLCRHDSCIAAVLSVMRGASAIRRPLSTATTRTRILFVVMCACRCAPQRDCLSIARRCCCCCCCVALRLRCRAGREHRTRRQSSRMSAMFSAALCSALSALLCSALRCSAESAHRALPRRVGVGNSQQQTHTHNTHESTRSRHEAACTRTERGASPISHRRTQAQRHCACWALLAHWAQL